MAQGEEKYNFFGDDDRGVWIKSLEDHGTFIRVLRKDTPKDGICLKGRFAYTTKRRPWKARRAKTEAYVDDQRGLYDRFDCKDLMILLGGMIPRQHHNCEV